MGKVSACFRGACTIILDCVDGGHMKPYPIRTFHMPRLLSIQRAPKPFLRVEIYGDAHTCGPKREYLNYCSLYSFRVVCIRGVHIHCDSYLVTPLNLTLGWRAVECREWNPYPLRHVKSRGSQKYLVTEPRISRFWASNTDRCAWARQRELSFPHSRVQSTIKGLHP